LGVSQLGMSECFPDCVAVEVAEVFDLEGLFSFAADIAPMCSG
jgi:hypothetical protein